MLIYARNLSTVFFLFFLSAAPAFSDDSTSPGEWITERQQLADSGIHRYSPSPDGPASTDPAQLAQAMGAPAEFLTDAILEGPSASAQALNGLGEIKPRLGKTFTMLSTGIAGTAAARPGTDLSSAVTGDDHVVLRLELNPPPGGRHLSFQYRFLTAEYPEFSDTDYQDTFIAYVTDAGGRRQIAGTTSNDEALFPVADASAEGTGFNLYTDHSGQLEGDFSFGLPAAGMTSWQKVSEPIAAEGPVTLEFVLREGGDGLLDSAVLLDHLSLTAFNRRQVIRSETSRGSLPAALDCISREGPVIGAVADGEAWFVDEAWNLPGPGEVEYSLVDGQAPEDGGYDEWGGDRRLNSIVVRTYLGPHGWQSIAQYNAPEEFNRGGDEDVGERTVIPRIHYRPDDPALGHIIVEPPIPLLRPPLILVHGLWSNPSIAWNESPLVGDSRFNVYRVNYENTNAAPFSESVTRPSFQIREACQELRADGITMVQADFISHSMGGNIARNFETYAPGLINKLFTINVPHTGTPLANFLVSFLERLEARPAFVQALVLGLFEKLRRPIHLGAIHDLAKNSDAINAIAHTPVPAHALVGTGGSELTLAPGRLSPFYKTLEFLIGGDLTGIFSPEQQHDFLVGRPSQEGGMPILAWSSFGGLDSIHTRAQKSEAYTERIIELLNSPANGKYFAFFPPPASLPDTAPDTHETSGSESSREFEDVSAGDIAILAPSPGSVVGSGEPMPFTLATQNDFDLQRAALLTPLEATFVEEAPFSGTLTIPEDFVGALNVGAIGSDSAGNVTLSDFLQVQVETDAILESIEITNRYPVLFDGQDRRQLGVIGAFDDTIIRSLTDPSTGTEYISTNPAIVEVTPTGLLIPRGEGTTTVIAQNSELQASVNVIVWDTDLVFQDRFK